MKRFAALLATICLCIALSPSAHAVTIKKKKKVDLSANPLANVKSKQPDKELFDKAMKALKKGKFDIARLDLQTLLNTYPDSEYQMRAKLAVGDTWYKEGGSAALTQAESEYKDFITFFPNTPEAAEAQMKIGDIYFQQMEKPDRDPQNAVQAEAAYRQMIEQFPDSTLIPRAKQRLREVQEVMAQRQFEIGQFYASQENWPGAIARLQTVADSYPLFSKSDMTLITIGDAYASEAARTQMLNIPAKAKAELVKAYNQRAAEAYDRVVTQYPMAPHVEDAKDRLIAMGLPVPEPTPAQLAESETEENSRVSMKLKDRAMMLVTHGPSTVDAARVGEPTLTDPPPVLAPQVNQQTVAMFNAAIKGEPLPSLNSGPLGGAAGATATASAAQGGAATGSNGQGLTLEAVPESQGAGGSGTDASVEIVNPNTGATPAASEGNNNQPPGEAPPPSSQPNPANAENPEAVYGLKQPVAATGNTTLPPVDKPAAAPDQINDVKGSGGNTAQVQTGATASNKHKKAPYNANKESSSKHKKKKGVDKLNPF